MISLGLPVLTVWPDAMWDEPYFMFERLKSARIAAGYVSAAAAAAQMSVNLSTYRAHENGQNNFDRETAQIYAQAFQVTADYLIGDEKVRTHQWKRPDVPSKPDHETENLVEAQIATVIELDPLSHETSRDFSRRTSPSRLWAVPLDVLSSLAAREKDVVAMFYVGQDIPTSIRNGDVLFFDTSIDEITDAGIYAIRDQVGCFAVASVEPSVSPPEFVRVTFGGGPPMKVARQDLDVLGKHLFRLTA